MHVIHPATANSATNAMSGSYKRMDAARCFKDVDGSGGKLKSS